MQADHFPSSTDYAPVNITQDAVGLHCCQGTLLTHVRLAICQDPQILSAGLLPSLSLPSLYQYKGLFLPKCSIRHLSLRNSIKFLLVHSSTLPTSLWMAALPSKVSAILHTLNWFSFMPAANLMSVHSLHHLSDHWQGAKETNPRINPPGTALVTDLQVEYDPQLTITLCDWQSNHFLSIHLSTIR